MGGFSLARDLAAGKRVVSMRRVLLTWAIYSFAFWLTAKIVPGFRIAGLWDAVLVAAIFGIVNWLLGTLLYGTLVVLTLGIAYLLSIITHWVINAVLLKITGALTSPSRGPQLRNGAHRGARDELARKGRLLHRLAVHAHHAAWRHLSLSLARWLS